MPETQAQREARWAAARARQEAYRNSPEAAAIRAQRIADDLCVVDRTEQGDRCVTHGVVADLGHDLDINGYTTADGTARDD